MKINNLALTLVACGLLACTTYAAPILTVTPTGANASGNREWLVEVTPDASLFHDPPDDNPDRGLGGSIAVELAFAIDHTDLLGVDVNTAAWENETPGNNPFTGTVTEGLWLDLIGDRTFGAFGSIFFTSDDPMRLFTIETAGEGLTTLRSGVAASGHPVNGARIAQAGMNFDGYTGSVTVPEPASVLLAGLGLAMMASVMGRRRAA
jgi:hypothetical protein